MTAANGIVARRLVVDHATDAGIVRALEIDEVVVEGGTSVAVMGPSGCGKSTLLGLLAGLAIPTRGSVTVGSVVVSELSDHDRLAFRRDALGMVYQADNLLPHLTVEENVGLQRAICRRDDATADDPTEVLVRLGLGALRERFPDQLSGGQRQRVAVARAVVHRPAVILADEPTGALDADSARGVIGLLTDVQHDIGATLVLVTHDPGVACHADGCIEMVRPTTSPEAADAR